MRSEYIYLIYTDGHGPDSTYRQRQLLSAFTVKREAHVWLARSMWCSETATLWRLRDGLCEAQGGNKGKVQIDWEPKLIRMN